MKENYSSDNDSKAWNAFKQGSEEAFAGMYQKNASMLFSYGMHISRDEDLVKDCIQTLFIDLWDSRQTLGDIQAIKYYLFKCLKRRIVAELLKKKPYKSIHELTEDYDFEIVISPEFTLLAEQTSKEEQETLLQALNKLTKRQKEAIYHLYYNNLSHQEVAALMSIKITAVYNLVYQALVSLKKIMTKAHFSLFFLASFLA
jgi:RNA polymerase sigma factor (sigma-70 family)